MPTPASGPISISNVNTEVGAAATTARDMAWVRSNTKDTASALGSIRSRAWYQKNNAGNCNNGNCNCGGNCGNIQCGQCYASQCVNCVNCDGRAWLQVNCNCACTYNCNANLWSYNCNCACQCDCGSTCFPAGALVLMWDGSWKTIETVLQGELLMGADGKPTECLEAYVNILGPRNMYVFAEHPEHEWSDEHLHWAKQDGLEWWWSASPDQWRYEVYAGFVVGLKDNYSLFSGKTAYAHVDGWVNRTPTKVSRDAETKVYLPITDGTPIIVNGYVVTGGTNEFQYDYASFKWDEHKIKK
jgi:hypothetical protein